MLLKRFLAAALMLLAPQALFPFARARNFSAGASPTLQNPARGPRSARPAARALVSPSRPLWPGSRWTERERALAVRRGLQFIYRTSLREKNFAEYGSDYLWCFYTLSEAFSDPRARELARRMGVERACHWRLQHRSLPSNADASTVADYVFGSDAADSLGVRDDRLKEEIRRVATRFSARSLLLFDPLTEPPPVDVPDRCDFCRSTSGRGATLCTVCKRPLRMRTRYDVWYDALIIAYSGERYGVTLGARYKDVLRWLPSLRPYRGSANGIGEEFYDTVYAITHVVYTLNDYGIYLLDRRLLREEFEFLKTHMHVAISTHDADMLGEFMDSLRAFGVRTDDPLMRKGMEYLLARQNADGSWGNTREKDIYLRYHPTWNAVAALSEYGWRGEGLSHPELLPMLEGWAEAAGAGAHACCGPVSASF